MLLVTCLMTSHAASMTLQEETKCMDTYLREIDVSNDYAYYLLPLYAKSLENADDCPTYIEACLMGILNNGVNSAIKLLSNYEIFLDQQSEIEEKLQNSSSDCLREKLRELKYHELLLARRKPRFFDQYDFESKANIALLMCSGNDIFEIMFDKYIELAEKKTPSVAGFDCLRKYIYNETLNETSTNGDCSYYHDYNHNFKLAFSFLIFEKFKSFNYECIESTMKNSTIDQSFLKYFLGLKLDDNLKKSEKEKFVKTLIKFSDEILPCIWELQ